ncbi:unnamed protein product [Spirodela intermedia]|uniref:Uncharacterized protein n=2 Tax=Spirodela intermedia TaxID=51605 RepID=A0A7I8KRR1_SPIIN|nr:unnamed protein product [Spirodela intermedia]
MADTKGEEFLDAGQLTKRKPEAEAAADVPAEVEVKKRKPGSSPDRLHEAWGGEENEEDKRSPIESNGKSAAPSVDKGKGVVAAVDKGKGKMVVEEAEEEENGGDNDDSDDDGSDDDSGEVVLGEDYASDFSDDPLAEVDLSNILPSRTRRREPPLPGAYLVNDGDEEEEEDDEDVSD